MSFYADQLRKRYQDKKLLKRIKPIAGNSIKKILKKFKEGGVNSYSLPTHFNS